MVEKAIRKLNLRRRQWSTTSARVMTPDMAAQYRPIVALCSMDAIAPGPLHAKSGSQKVTRQVEPPSPLLRHQFPHPALVPAQGAAGVGQHVEFALGVFPEGD